MIAGAAAGFLLRPGWADVVVLGGPLEAPRLLDARRLELINPADPAARHPHSAALRSGPARDPKRRSPRARHAGPADRANLAGWLTTVERFARQAAAGLLRRYLSERRGLAGIGLVVEGLTPEDAARPGDRARAEDEALFRRAIEGGARRCGLPCFVWSERHLEVRAAEVLARSGIDVLAAVAGLELPRHARAPAGRRASAIAAWFVLATQRPDGPRR